MALCAVWEESLQRLRGANTNKRGLSTRKIPTRAWVRVDAIDVGAPGSLGSSGQPPIIEAGEEACLSRLV